MGRCGWFWIVLGRFGVVMGRFRSFWIVLGHFGSFWVVPRFSNYALTARAYPGFRSMKRLGILLLLLDGMLLVHRR